MEAYLDSKTVARSREAELGVVSVLLTIALVIEFSQVYVVDQVADSTDVLIYVFGGILGSRLLRYLLYGIRTENEVGIPTSTISQDGLGRRSISRIWIAGLIVALGLYLAVKHPAWPILQTILVFVFSSLVYFRWYFYPFFFVMLFTVGDLYPLTGQLAIQEYDSLLLAATGGLLVSPYLNNFHVVGVVGGWFKVGWFLLACSLITGSVIGVYRLPMSDWGDQLSVYFTKWNVLRVGKGILWGLVFYRLTYLLQVRDRILWSRYFILGMLLASAYVGCWVAFERAIFPGIFNLSEVYRATGPFFTMHIGDQHIDAFLILVFPVVFGTTTSCVQRIDGWRNFALVFMCFLILTLTCHAVFATMSRGTLLALSVQLSLLLMGFFLSRGRVVIKTAIVSLVIVIVPLIGLFSLVFYSALANRFESSIEDTQGRFEHWSTIVQKGTTGIGGLIVGHGIGCFPSMMAVHRELAIPPVVWHADGKNGYIKLQPGWPLYIERLALPLEHASESSPRLCVESIGRDGERVGLYRVEKSLLQSYRYQETENLVKSGNDTTLGWPSDFTEDTSDDHKFSRFRPVYIGVSPPRIASLVLKNSDQGNDMISNSSSYPWIFTCDDHLVWRAKNFLVHAYYEQGLLGVVAWICLVVASVCYGLHALGSTDFDQQIILWLGLSVIGFVIVGMFGTLIDTPWISALVLGCMALIDVKERKAKVAL